ncbi:MAG TPA: hypothetical protein VKR06_19000 [Ktedonosporobacter sp.]|nr:hypothetical protein [Ktedonosporobacter sp.]
MPPFSYTGTKLIQDEKIQEALERYRFSAEQKTPKQGLLHSFGKALARFTQHYGWKQEEKRMELPSMRP